MQILFDSQLLYLSSSLHQMLYNVGSWRN